MVQKSYLQSEVRQYHCKGRQTAVLMAQGSWGSLYGWRRMAWHSGGHSQHLSHPYCPDPVSPSSPTPALPSAAAFSTALAFSLLHFQWPQGLLDFRSQRHSVLITHLLWKAIVVCKPEILVSMLYSAMLMRIKSIHEKYLLSMLIIYFSNITILDSSFFLQSQYTVHSMSSVYR